MKKGNPFTLTFGIEPSEIVNRYDDTETIVSCFNAPHPVSRVFLIDGVRGIGKTVLLTVVTSILLEENDWVVADLNPTQDLLYDLAMRLSDECRKLTDVFRSGFSVSVAGFGLGVNGAQQRDSVSIIEEILTELTDKGKKLLITIDEVRCDDNMRKFASQFQIFLRKKYNVYLIMTGLYENIYEIQNDPALTFLLRVPRIALEPLAIHRIAKQYSEIFSIDSKEATYLAELTKGYSFGFQALGMLYYEHRDEYDMDRIISEYDDMLDDFVYKKIWESMSEKDREVIRAFSEDRQKVSDILEKTGMTSSSFAKYRDRLIKKGVLRTAGHGYVELTLPRFSEITSAYR